MKKVDKVAKISLDDQFLEVDEVEKCCSEFLNLLDLTTKDTKIDVHCWIGFIKECVQRLYNVEVL